MPKPLIILDHHFLNASKEFLIRHFSELKALGYQKILFEMNQEISLSDFKQHLKKMVRTSGPDETTDIFFQSLHRLFDAIEAFGFACEFIDPESMAVAQSFDRYLRSIKDPSELAKVKALRERATAERDVYMSSRILAESARLSGAVIAFVGFKHTELLKRLTAAGLEHVAVLFDDCRAHTPKIWGEKTSETREWSLMSDPRYRHAHYAQDVMYLDWAREESVPFYVVKAQLGLIPLKACVYPSLVAQQLAASLEVEPELRVDESYHVQAYLPIELEVKIKATYPSLRFFQTKDTLCIPGINLAEQQQHIPRF